MITFENILFNAQGSSKKDQVFALTLSGAEDVSVKNCQFANKGYSSILNNCSGNVTIEDCEFNCVDVYNPIEGSQSVSNGNVAVVNCEFIGVPGNNYINFYQFAEGTCHEVKDCTFQPDMGNNIVRISNRTSAKADFNISDCYYAYPVDGTATNYTGFLICQDYTNKSGIKQNFSGCKVSFSNVKRGGAVLNAESDHVFYVYEDGKGIISDNNPEIIFD